MEIQAALKSATKTIFKPVCKLPTEHLIGPEKEPPSFALPKLLAQDALDAFKVGDQQKGFDLYDKAYAAFAVRAEEVVANANDLKTPCSENRRARPRKIKVPLVHDVTKGGNQPLKVSVISNVLQKTKSISAKLTAAWKFGGRRWAALTRTLTRIKDNLHVSDDDDISAIIQDVERLCDKVANLTAVATATPAGTAEYQALWAPYSDSVCTAAVIRKATSSLLPTEKDKAKADADRSWEEWKQSQMEGSASGAHKFPKLPSRWTPPDVFDKNGVRATDAASILDVEKIKYGELWRAVKEPPEVGNCNNEPCPRMEPAYLRNMSNSFKRKTSVAPDG